MGGGGEVGANTNFTNFTNFVNFVKFVKFVKFVNSCVRTLGVIPAHRDCQAAYVQRDGLFPSDKQLRLLV